MQGNDLLVSVLVAVGLVAAAVLLFQAGAAYRTMEQASQPSATAIYSAEDFRVPLASYARRSLLQCLSGRLEVGTGLRLLDGGFDLRSRERWEEREIERLVRSGGLLKLCQDLMVLGPEEATEVVNEWLSRYLTRYRQSLAFALDPSRSPPPVHVVVLRSEMEAGPGAESGKPAAAATGRVLPPEVVEGEMLLRTREGIFLLCLAAGNLELTGAHPRICEIVREARKQRQEMPADTEIPGMFRMPMEDAGLCNRQLLGYALVATSPNPRLAADVLVGLGKDVVVRKFSFTEWSTDGAAPLADTRVPYDALPTPGPVDYSTGVFTVKWLPALTDEEFDRIVEVVLPDGTDESD